MDVDREAIRLKIRSRIMALADELTDKIMHIARDVAREQLLQMVGELEVRAIAAVSDLAAAPAADRPPRSQAAEPFVVPIIPAVIPRTPATKQPNGRDMQLTQADPEARTSDGKKLPTCRRCGFYGGNTRGCGRSHQTLPGAKPAIHGDDDEAEPPRDGHACSWLAVPTPDVAVAPPRVPVRREPAAAARSPQAPVATVQVATPAAHERLSEPPDQDDAPGTPRTVGTRAETKPSSTGRWAEPGEPLRLGIDKREVCRLHGWVGNLAFLRERHDLCEGGEHAAPNAEPEPDTDEDSDPVVEVAADVADDEEVPTFIGNHRRRRRNPEAERAKTIPLKKITRADLHDDGLVYASELAELDKIRPRNRSQCVNGMRPCPFMGCRYHLALDVNVETGSIKIAFPDRDLDEMAETCALDVADRGGRTLEGVGALLNVTRERLRQIEYKAVMALKMSGQADVLLGYEPPVPPDQN